MNPTGRLRAARDTLLEHRTDAAAATDAFRWPDVGPHFNWAVDWFDEIAIGNEKTALRIVEEDGSSREVTFDAMANRSDRVGQWRSAAAGACLMICVSAAVRS